MWKLFISFLAHLNFYFYLKKLDYIKVFFYHMYIFQFILVTLCTSKLYFLNNFYYN